MPIVDLAPAFRGEQQLTDLIAPVTKEDLIGWTNELVDEQQAIIANAVDADVTFVPHDPAANDTFAAPGTDTAQAWTLGHVIVHATAGSEEAAALGLTLARGVKIEGRSRYELPWESVTSVDQLTQRLEESRRMRLAMLQAWPDQPDLTNAYEPWEGAPAVNAIGRTLLGLSHDDSHLEQLREIMRQAKATASS